MDYKMANCSNISISSSTEFHFDVGMAFTTVTLGLINVMVLFGNSLVVFAVITTRKLRTVTNIYIMSLACADLLLGLSVLPFSISREVLDYWPFGTLWCSMWLAIDVLLCTASILNLCAISLDRYLAVTRPIQYPCTMSRKKGKIIVACVWILAFVISLPPLIGWNDAVDLENGDSDSTMKLNITAFNVTNITGGFYQSFEIVHVVQKDKNEFNSINVNCISERLECELTKTRGYRIYAALGSFYIPMFVMVFFYFRIYSAAVKTASSLRTGILTTKKKYDVHNTNGCQNADNYSLRVHRGGTPLARSPSSRVPHRRASAFVSSEPNFEHYLDVDPELSSRSRRRSYGCSNGHGSTNISQTREDKKDGHSLRAERRNSSGRRKHKYLRENSNNEMSSFLKLSPRSYSDSNAYVQVNTSQCATDSPFLPKRKLSSKSLTSSFNGNIRQRAVAFLHDTKTSQKSHIRKFHRETKAAKTVAIIVGAFILCWLPFFTIYLMGAFCDNCVPPLPFSIIFWLGYCNSMLNPCIYALFSRDFRFAFRKILYCKRFCKPEKFLRTDGNFIARRKFVTPPLESESYSDS